MSYLDAAYQVLHDAGQPLRYEEITEHALAMQLITPQGLTPEATMASRLYTDTLQQGTRFVRAGKGAFGLVDWQPVGIKAQVQQINQATRDQLGDYLHAMPFGRFETLIGELLIQMGFEEDTVKVTARPGDGGIDVIGVYRATGLTEVHAAVQVKRWKRNVQAPTVTALRGSLQVHQQGIIITTSDFSKGAREEAEAPNKTRVSLINGQKLIELLVLHNVGVRETVHRVISLDDWWSEIAGQVPPSPKTPSPQTTTPPTAAQPPVEDLTTRAKSPQQKPTGFTFVGQFYAVTTWRSLLVMLCEILAERHPDDFIPRALTVRGPRRSHIAATPDDMTTPTPIGGTGLWLETNQSSRSAQRVAELLSQAFGYSAGDISISTD